MRKTFGLAAIAILAIPFTVYSAKAIKLFCIGDSIVKSGFPDENLIILLGPSFDVYAAGSSHATALRNTNVNIWTKGPWDALWKYKPDAVTIMMGTNDTKDANWPTYGKNFEADYSDLIDTAGSAPSKPVVIPVLPPPIFTNGLGIVNGVMVKNILPIEKKVAEAKKLAYIDANTPLLAHSEVFSDGVHPNAAGMDSLAAIYYRGIASMSKRIACITDHAPTIIHAKTGKTWADSLTYPVQLGRLFGWGTLVQNFGATGASIRSNGKTPILTAARLKSLRAWKPHVVTIMLGTYDASASGWNQTAFEQDLSNLLDSLATIKPQPDVRLVLPPPVFKSSSTVDATTLKDKILPALAKVAAAKSVSVIDVNARFQNLSRLVPDGVVPGAAGQDSIAAILHEALGSPATGVGKRSTVPKLSVRTTSTSLVVHSENAEDLHVELFSLDGRSILSQRVPAFLASRSFEIPLGGLGKGTFLYRVRSQGTSSSGTISHF